MSAVVVVGIVVVVVEVLAGNVASYIRWVTCLLLGTCIISSFSELALRSQITAGNMIFFRGMQCGSTIQWIWVKQNAALGEMKHFF